MIPIVAPVVGLTKRFARALRLGWSETEFRGLLYMVTLTIGAGTIFYQAVERWGWIDSLYFTVITLTTIGYGDLSPSTPGSKLFTVVLVLVGIGLLVSFVEPVARYAAEDQASKRRSRDDPSPP